FPLGLASFAVVVSLGGFALVLLLAPVIVIWTPVTVFGWIVESPLQALPLAVAGVPAVLLSLNLYDGLAWLWALFARVMLGPSTMQLHERVDDLRDARARIIAAADAERRRIERDLHDGAQQRLVALAMDLGMARAKLETDPAAATALVGEAHEEAKRALAELRDLARGIHPAVLADRGLDAAISALAARSPVPVGVDVTAGRLPGPVESAAYFVVAEALANAAKHAVASEIGVRITRHRDLLIVEVIDDGVGGADPAGGTGLRGLADRVAAVDGHLTITSPAGGPTMIRAELPCAS
ncbi:MAG: histidine kinase, partial [Actinomycetes bacterium]